MTVANADRCIANTLIYEGGFARTKADRGDWTSGKIGEGRLAGTAYGIAAMTLTERGLPEDFDLSTLTRDQAIALYREKEWKEVAGDFMPKGIDQIVYDGTVNSGKGRGIPWVGKAVGSKRPTIALAVARDATALDFDQRREAIKKATAARVSFLQGLSIFKTFGAGWMKRCAGMEAIGVKMVLEDSRAAPADIKKELEAEASAAKTQANKSAAGSATSGAAGGATGYQVDPTSIDWSHIGWGVVTFLAVVSVIALALEAYKHTQRSKAYAEAANGG